jgi:putative colanic acid biosynthesis acetyltransferase WcaF
MSGVSDEPRVQLAHTHPGAYRPGRSYPVRALWVIVEALTLLNPLLVSYRFKVAALRLFGAEIGDGLVLKPGVHVKHPWRLRIGDNCWLGERAWIDNMEDVTLGSNVVVSQGAYLCTGNHDWSDPVMPLAPRAILVEDGAWVGAFSRVAPGTTIAAGSVVVLGGVVFSDTEPWGIYRGNPAERVGTRNLRGADAHLTDS